MTFRLALKVEGPNPLYWQTLDQLIGEADIPIDPDASYVPQGEIVRTLAGGGYARGFASAIWHWNIISNQKRAILREFCPGASAEVYIETPSNEMTVCGDQEWIQALAIMHWQAGDEDQQAGTTLGLEIMFSHLIEV